VRVGFVVNQVATEEPQYTTTRLAVAATTRDHETWLMGVDDFSHLPDGSVTARARRSSASHRSLDRYLDDLRGEKGIEQQVRVDDLDVLVMRNDPADDVIERPWAVTSGVLFAQLAVARGVLVVNDPSHLANAVNKTYFQHFPAAARPRTLISRDPEMIAAFVEEQGGAAILKPLQGSGGSGVFLVSDEESPNLNQITEAIARDGYVVAQERLRGSEDGDVRLFVMNGSVLCHEGAYAAFRRVPSNDDPRSNMAAGGTAEAVEVTDEMSALVELARPKLVADGMFFVGLDIVGTKLMEVNVFSPGGLGSVHQLYDVDFSQVVIEALERKVAHRHSGSVELTNAQLATLPALEPA
jgi:glutathione synthase